jgi:protein-disulfide isomerase
MAKEIKKDFSGVYVPALVVLLLVAVFFVGRLSSQVETMKNGDAGAGAEVVGDQEGGEALAIGESDLNNMAADLDLNKKDFAKCLDSGKYEQKVNDDLAYGGEVGVSGTPSFFVNGVMLVGAQPIEEFEKVIDAELDGTGVKAERKDIKMGVGAVRGSSDAPVKIVEFADFECPYCAGVVPTIDGLFEKYGDKISLEYRHFPLGFHASAQKAAEASECAREQGKFWEMHDMIFGVQG